VGSLNRSSSSYYERKEGELGREIGMPKIMMLMTPTAPWRTAARKKSDLQLAPREVKLPSSNLLTISPTRDEVERMLKAKP